MNVGKFENNVHAMLPRERTRFVQRCRREIDRMHVKPLLCKPDAVTPLSVGNRQYPARRRQQRLAFDKKILVDALLLEAGDDLRPAGAISK